MNRLLSALVGFVLFSVCVAATPSCWGDIGCARIIDVGQGGQGFPCGTLEAGRTEDLLLTINESIVHAAAKKLATYVIRVRDAQGSDCSGVAFVSKPNGFTQTCDNQMYTAYESPAGRTEFSLTASSNGYQVSVAYAIQGDQIGMPYVGFVQATSLKSTSSPMTSATTINKTDVRGPDRFGCTPDGSTAQDTQGCSDCCSENKFGSGRKLCHWNKWTTQKICGCVADGECVYDTDYETACCSQRGHYGGWPGCSPVPIMPYTPSKCGCPVQSDPAHVSSLVV